MKSRPLSPRRAQFVEEYLVDLNATQAAIRAGYAPRVANREGCRLLSNADVSAALVARKAARLERVEVNQDDVLREVLLIARTTMDDLFDFDGERFTFKRPQDVPKAMRRAIQSIKVKRYIDGKGDDGREVEITEIKLWSKDAALDKLMRHLGLYVDKVEHTGKDGAPLLLEAVRELITAARARRAERVSA